MNLSELTHTEYEVKKLKERIEELETANKSFRQLWYGTMLPTGERIEPPFDMAPCPMCPSQIRNLSAVAHNLLVRWDSGNWARYYIEELRDAL